MFRGRGWEVLTGPRHALFSYCEVWPLWREDLGGWGAPLLNLRCPLGLINPILPLGLWDLHFRLGQVLQEPTCAVCLNSARCVHFFLQVISGVFWGHFYGLSSQKMKGNEAWKMGSDVHQRSRHKQRNPQLFFEHHYIVESLTLLPLKTF